MRKPTKLTEIMEAILKDMSEADKATIIDTEEDDLIQLGQEHTERKQSLAR